MATKQNTAADVVYSTNYIESSLPIRDVRTWLRSQPSVTSLAVVGTEGGFGLVTRNHLNQTLVNHANDPGLLDQPVSNIMITEPVIVGSSTSIENVVGTLLAHANENGDAFTDIVVANGEKFIGLISAHDVLVDHIQGLMHRLSALEAQSTSLIKKNRELFENSFRVGQTETQFQLVFQSAPLPLALFDKDGKYVNGNTRFLRLVQYGSNQVDRNMHFGRFFAAEFNELRDNLNARWAGGGDDTLIQMVLLTQNQDLLPVEACAELLPDLGQIIVGITALNLPQASEPSEDASADVIQEPPAPKPTRSAVHSAARRPGRITQAIKQKIDSYPGHDLARSVATNLIDKEEHIDRMMRKLEGIIAITEQLETRERDAREAAQTEPEEDGNRHLRGDLAEFSMVDLCQILIQGTKTGRLLISAAQGEAPLGEVFFYCGSIVHAETAEGIAGADALGHVVSCRNGYFDFIFDENSPQVTIKGDSMGLLMEACRMLDESTARG